jgi:nitrite reductase (NO-forming)
VNGLKFNNSMPSFPLTDQDIANVLTFVYNSFGNSGLAVTPEEVKALRAHPPAPSATPAPKNSFE